jgi:putative membrane protein insertion efficiency factor
MGVAAPSPQPPRGGSGSLGRRIARVFDRAASAVLIAGVLLYKCTLSPLLGRHCRFRPTCSTYFREAVEKYGAVRGGLRGIARICRCHPWHPGGYDPP